MQPAFINYWAASVLLGRAGKLQRGCWRSWFRFPKLFPELRQNTRGSPKIPAPPLCEHPRSLRSCWAPLSSPGCMMPGQPRYLEPRYLFGALVFIYLVPWYLVPKYLLIWCPRVYLVLKYLVPTRLFGTQALIWCLGSYLAPRYLVPRDLTWCPGIYFFGTWMSAAQVLIQCPGIDLFGAQVLIWFPSTGCPGTWCPGIH